MIEKVKFLSIISPKKGINRMVDTYLSRYEIHLENALSGLKTAKDLRSYIEMNPYKDVLEKAQGLVESYHDLITDQTGRSMKLEEAAEVINSLDTQLEELTDQKNILVHQRDELEASRDRVMPSAGPNYNVKEILKFRFMRFRFGRISRGYHEKFSSYAYETIDTAMFKCKEEGDYVWVVYFVSESLADKIDAIYASMHFERCLLPDEYEGTPVGVGHVLDDRIGGLQKEVDEANGNTVEAMNSRGDELATALRCIRTFSTNFDVREIATATKHNTHNFYILYRWITKNDAKKFRKEIEYDSDTFCIIKDGHDSIMNIPPTKMENPGLFRPFEMYMEMHRLPSYNELDPAMLIGTTYSTLFDFIFGDAGQGPCLLIGGFLLYRFKKIRLAGIISCCGMFSTIFGLLFGNVFGFENIIGVVWLRSQEAMTDLPLIGKLSTVFVVAVAIGTGVVLLCIILNIINNLGTHDVEKAYSDTDGVAGLIFHFTLTPVVVLYMTGSPFPAIVILVIMFLVSLLVIFFKGPLTTALEKKAERMETGLGMFITQGIFEPLEVLLGYFSNTLSFVRVDAFAVSHVAMMQVVLMLAGAEAGGNTNRAMVISDNLFVRGMKGLVVDIQVLRLEYYELFSRLYRGSDRAFEPYGKAAGEQ